MTSLTNRPMLANFAHYPEAEWDSIARQFADLSVYQTTAYAEGHWPGKEVVHFTLTENNQVVACAQLVIGRIPLVRKGIAYLRWGPLVRRIGTSTVDAVVLHRALEAIKVEFVERRGMLLQIVPRVSCNAENDSILLSSFQSLDFRASDAKAYRTICVDLSPEFDIIRKNFDKKWRNQLNAAEKLEMSVESSREVQDFDRFLKIYDEMVDRKHFDSSVDPREFLSVHQKLLPGSRFLILSALKEKELVACLIIAVQPDTAIYLLGASTELGRTLKSSYLLHWKAIQELKQLGCMWYDLGGIDELENPGGYKFKSGFGGIEVAQIPSHIAGRGLWLSLFERYLRRSVRRAQKSRT